ncbi:hypothetical protein, partial [Methylococcus sp. S1M]|uniref:hypothetical protein n=1 Tax=Methylococcus sp. S1M TaxID=3438966 RepID=UPI003ED8ED64
TLVYAYIIAILISLSTALTVTTALCVALLTFSKEAAETPPLIRWLQPLYGRWLRWAAIHPARPAPGNHAASHQATP